MKDRSVEFPNRYKLVSVPGTDGVVDLIPSPGEVTEEGTPINKATLLADKTAALFGLDGDSTPDQALQALVPAIGSIQYAGLDLERESGGRYLLCDGRFILDSEYPEYTEAVGYRLGLIGSSSVSKKALSGGGYTYIDGGCMVDANTAIGVRAYYSTYYRPSAVVQKLDAPNVYYKETALSGAMDSIHELYGIWSVSEYIAIVYLTDSRTKISIDLLSNTTFNLVKSLRVSPGSFQVDANSIVYDCNRIGDNIVLALANKVGAAGWQGTHYAVKVPIDGSATSVMATIGASANQYCLIAVTPYGVVRSTLTSLMIHRPDGTTRTLSPGAYISINSCIRLGNEYVLAVGQGNYNKNVYAFRVTPEMGGTLHDVPCPPARLGTLNFGCVNLVEDLLTVSLQFDSTDPRFKSEYNGTYAISGDPIQMTKISGTSVTPTAFKSYSGLIKLLDSSVAYYGLGAGNRSIPNIPAVGTGVSDQAAYVKVKDGWA